MLNVHRRQLVVGPEPSVARPGWRCEQLDHATWLSHCPELRSESTLDADGNAWSLLGLAVQTLADAADPLDQIASATTAAVPTLYSSWAGRWLLVGDGRVHLDASGLLGCFYGTDGAGRAWASSSPALLSQAIAPEGGLRADPRELRYAQGVFWYPPPRSRLDGMRRLLPSQVLDLRDGAVHPRRLLPAIEPDRGYDETLELLGDALVVGLGRLPLAGEPLWLSLSAGMDSRVVLAAAHRAGIPFVPFTRIAARMRAADQLIPPRLARALGKDLVVHRRGWRRRRQTERDRLPLVMAHSARHVCEGDAQPLLHGVRDTMEGISTGGWAFDVGKALWRGQLPSAVTDPAQDARQLAQAFGEPDDSSATAGLCEWLEWTVRTPEAHLDWRDRHYIEQKLAGWQSSKEQVYDLVALERFPVLNAARSYALLLEVDEARRIERRHQHDLVERLCPELAGYPANPSDRELGLWRVAAVKARDDPRGLIRRVWRRAGGAARRRTLGVVRRARSG